MEEKKFDFWQDHSRNYLEMALAADHREIPKNSDGYGKRTGDCGDTIEIYIQLDVTGKITHVSYDTDGCLNTNACANTVAVMAEGRRAVEAWEITPEKVAEYLETLPENEIHCAELAIGALYRALASLKTFSPGTHE
jgi:nitrogen fixation NifU-like protein